MKQSADEPIDALVDRLYAALAAGDADALERVLAPDFVAHFADGMPVGGGRHDGAAPARDEGWWAIGRAFSVRAEPAERIRCADGRLLVRGRYRGHRRADDAPVDAEFNHLWSARDGRLVELRQLTDTARWALVDV